VNPSQQGDRSVTNRNRLGYPPPARARMTASFFWAFSIGILFLGPTVGSQNAKAETRAHTKQKTIYDQVDDWSLKTLDGKTIAFSDFRGKVVFLNFWATWCEPCVSEMPGIQRLIGIMKDHDVAFLLVTDEKKEKVCRLLEKHGMELPVYIQDQNRPKMFKTKKLPITYILDKEGNIAMRRTGSTEWDDPACQDFIRDLIHRSTK
jgi:thiol-disulfide isomerase/thioredoxin